MEDIIKEGSLKIDFYASIKKDKAYENTVKSIHMHKRVLRYARFKCKIIVNA